MDNSSIKNEVKKIVGQIETLAQQVSTHLDKGSQPDMLKAATELVKNSTTFTFMLGTLVEAEKNPSKMKKKNPAMKRVNWQRKRDANGKFIKN